MSGKDEFKNKTSLEASTSNVNISVREYSKGSQGFQGADKTFIETNRKGKVAVLETQSLSELVLTGYAHADFDTTNMLSASWIASASKVKHINDIQRYFLNMWNSVGISHFEYFQDRMLNNNSYLSGPADNKSLSKEFVDIDQNFITNFMGVAYEGTKSFNKNFFRQLTNLSNLMVLFRYYEVHRCKELFVSLKKELDLYASGKKLTLVRVVFDPSTSLYEEVQGPDSSTDTTEAFLTLKVSLVASQIAHQIDEDITLLDQETKGNQSYSIPLKMAMKLLLQSIENASINMDESTVFPGAIKNTIISELNEYKDLKYSGSLSNQVIRYYSSITGSDMSLGVLSYNPQDEGDFSTATRLLEEGIVALRRSQMAPFGVTSQSIFWYSTIEGRDRNAYFSLLPVSFSEDGKELSNGGGGSVAITDFKAVFELIESGGYQENPEGSDGFTNFFSHYEGATLSMRGSGDDTVAEMSGASNPAKPSDITVFAASKISELSWSSNIIFIDGSRRSTGRDTNISTVLKGFGATGREAELINNSRGMFPGVVQLDKRSDADDSNAVQFSYDPLMSCYLLLITVFDNIQSFQGNWAGINSMDGTGDLQAGFNIDSFRQNKALNESISAVWSLHRDAFENIMKVTGSLSKGLPKNFREHSVQFRDVRTTFKGHLIELAQAVDSKKVAETMKTFVNNKLFLDSIPGKLWALRISKDLLNTENPFVQDVNKNLSTISFMYNKFLSPITEHTAGKGRFIEETGRFFLEAEDLYLYKTSSPRNKKRTKISEFISVEALQESVRDLQMILESMNNNSYGSKVETTLNSQLASDLLNYTFMKDIAASTTGTLVTQGSQTATLRSEINNNLSGSTKDAVSNQLTVIDNLLQHYYVRLREVSRLMIAHEVLVAAEPIFVTISLIEDMKDYLTTSEIDLNVVNDVLEEALSSLENLFTVLKIDQDIVRRIISAMTRQGDMVEKTDGSSVLAVRIPSSVKEDIKDVMLDLKGMLPQLFVSRRLKHLLQPLRSAFAMYNMSSKPKGMQFTGFNNFLEILPFDNEPFIIPDFDPTELAAVDFSMDPEVLSYYVDRAGIMTQDSGMHTPVGYLNSFLIKYGDVNESNIPSITVESEEYVRDTKSGRSNPKYTPGKRGEGLGVVLYHERPLTGYDHPENVTTRLNDVLKSISVAAKSKFQRENRRVVKRIPGRTSNDNVYLKEILSFSLRKFSPVTGTMSDSKIELEEFSEDDVYDSWLAGLGLSLNTKYPAVVLKNFLRSVKTHQTIPMSERFLRLSSAGESWLEGMILYDDSQADFMARSLKGLFKIDSIEKDAQMYRLRLWKHNEAFNELSRESQLFIAGQRNVKIYTTPLDFRDRVDLSSVANLEIKKLYTGFLPTDKGVQGAIPISFARSVDTGLIKRILVDTLDAITVKLHAKKDVANDETSAEDED
jgi:hypothetical protein